MSEEINGFALLRKHPVIMTIMTLCTVGGIIVAFLLAPAAWSIPRIVLAGVCCGAFSGLCIVAPKMFA